MHPTLGTGREGKKYILYKIKLLFSPGSQKNDGNNTLFMALDSVAGERTAKAGLVLYASLTLIYPTADQCKNPGILMFKK